MNADSRWPWLGWWLGLAAAGAQALALAAFYFHRDFTSDHLYPHLFAADVLSGRYPLSGWTLSSAPYFFPDFAFATLWLAVLGGDGTVFAAYAAGYYLALAAVLGWAAARVRPEWGARAWLVGPVLVNLLLGCRELTDHARYLWWLGIPGFHGGAVLLGMVVFALWFGPLETEPPPARRWLAVGLLAVGVLSDTLLLVQFAVPLLLAFAWCARGRWRESVRARSYALTLMRAVLIAALARVVLGVAGMFVFSKVLRYAPWPSDIFAAGAQLARDVGGTLAPHGTVFVLLGVVAVGWGLWRLRQSAGAPVRRLADAGVLVSLAVTLAMPVVTVYWKNSQHARYLLPWLVLPGWWCGLNILAWREHKAADLNPRTGRVGLGLLALLFILAGGVAAGTWSWESWRWPQPPAVRELVEGLRQRGLDHGLSDYWNAHHLNQLSHGALHLNQLRPDGRTYFWNNNAFWHFDVADAGRLASPRYNFVLMTRLDPAAITARFGPPAERVMIAGEELWLYAPESAAALTKKVESDVRQRLQGRPGAARLPPEP
ncbi:MAG: hypothetical protein A3G75_13630 [Verrucomicrobia bacterium RIFCSPLOWO2_12_FULL_64_8]|nr:MAG: hypothetical protein A3G75_13630 [Verrucomicrobia bacterium RIFCSPLOWO2_12_FULL_64_8]